MALKVDMNKAHDRLEWDFVEGVLLKFGFCEEWVSLVTNCVSLVRYHLLLSEKSVASFNPKKGLRHYHLTSSFWRQRYYLAWLISTWRGGSWRGFLWQEVIIFYHCFFFLVGDALFFIKVNERNCLKMKGILEAYCLASGQRSSRQVLCFLLQQHISECEGRFVQCVRG